MNIPWFDDEDIIVFPALENALEEPDGLLAAGGNLSVETLVNAYQNGIFPWFEPNQPIMWWSPSVRAVLPTNEIHISKNMRKLIKRQQYSIVIDSNFNQVLQHCRQSTHDRPSTWITEDMANAYKQLYDCGIAHSVEVYSNDAKLVGGLYGVFIRNCFCGESMFSRETNASKLALITLAQFLQQKNCKYIDCQMMTAHLESMGAFPMPRNEFMGLLYGMHENSHLIGKNWNELWLH